MTIELNLEDQQTLEALVACGRFKSPAEAIHCGLEVLEFNLKWSKEFQECIDQGVFAAEHNDFASDSELDALFAQHLPKSA